MAENQNTNLATVRFSSGVGNTLQIKFPPVKKEKSRFLPYLAFSGIEEHLQRNPKDTIVKKESIKLSNRYKDGFENAPVNEITTFERRISIRNIVILKGNRSYEDTDEGYIFTTIEPSKYAKKVLINNWEKVSYHKSNADLKELIINALSIPLSEKVSFSIKFYSSLKEKKNNSIVGSGDILCGKFNVILKETIEKKGVALYICYDNYEVQTNWFDRQPLGHGGILLIEKNGKTTYYEYGRYDKEEKGMVRKVTVPNVVWKKSEEKITETELNKVLSFLSTHSGQNKNITAAYIETNHIDVMLEYAKKKYGESNPNAGIKSSPYNKDRKEYNIINNNCGTFAKDVIMKDKDTKSFVTLLYATPEAIVKDFLQEGYKKVFYNSLTKKTTISE
jgi:hypothetical protein